MVSANGQPSTDYGHESSPVAGDRWPKTKARADTGSDAVDRRPLTECMPDLSPVRGNEHTRCERRGKINNRMKLEDGVRPSFETHEVCGV